MAETAGSDVVVTERERDPKLLIPRIEDYPTKARVRVIDGHRVAVPLFQKAERMLDGLNLFTETMEKTTEEERGFPSYGHRFLNLV